jgi:Cu/Ag efflux protein CusF
MRCGAGCVDKETIMKRITASMLGCALVTWAATLAAQVTVIPGARYTITATIEAVDQVARRVTIRTPQGELRTVQASPQVKRLAEIKPGDTVTATYYENIVLRLKAPGEPDVDRREAAITPGQGPRPVGTSGSQQTITATIAAIDLQEPSIAFKGPRGWSYRTKVQNRAALQQLKVGDRVDFVWTEATLMSVAVAKK